MSSTYSTVISKGSLYSLATSSAGVTIIEVMLTGIPFSIFENAWRVSPLNCMSDGGIILICTSLRLMSPDATSTVIGNSALPNMDSGTCVRMLMSASLFISTGIATS